MKKKLLIYSAHSEVVGGDVKYIVDILNRLDKSVYEIKLVTDKNCHFFNWADNWLNFQLDHDFLPTLPHLFEANLWEKLAFNLKRNSFFKTVLNHPLKSAPLEKYIGYVYKIASLYHLRLKIENFLIFTKVFKKEQPDIFWFNNGGYPGKEAGILASLIAKFIAKTPKTLMTFHNIPEKRNPLKPTDAIYDFLLNKSLDHVIAVSKILKNKLVSVRNFSEEKITTLYCGLPKLELLTESQIIEKKRSLGIDLEREILILTGNIDELRKGHDYSVKALSIVKNQFPKIVLLFIGQGLPERIISLKNLISAHDLDQNVMFLGQRYDIHELNSISNIVLVPSFGNEATPYTIKEGSRAGKPIITTQDGGCGEGIVNGLTGLTIEPENHHDLAEKILFLLKNKAKADEFGKNGRVFFENNFEITKISKAHQLILNSGQ